LMASSIVSFLIVYTYFSNDSWLVPLPARLDCVYVCFQRANARWLFLLLFGLALTALGWSLLVFGCLFFGTTWFLICVFSFYLSLIAYRLINFGRWIGSIQWLGQVVFLLLWLCLLFVRCSVVLLLGVFGRSVFALLQSDNFYFVSLLLKRELSYHFFVPPCGVVFFAWLRLPLASPGGICLFFIPCRSAWAYFLVISINCIYSFSTSCFHVLIFCDWNTFILFVM
jgi:hypothetical protein